MTIINTVSGGGDTIQEAGVLTPLVSGTITEVTATDLEGCENIKQYAFYQCWSLESVAIPEGIQYTQGHTFERCGQLKEVSLPESLTNLGEHDFESCYNLTSMTLPSGINTLPSYCFNGCSNLESINLDNIRNFGERCLASTKISGALDLSDKEYPNLSSGAFIDTKLTFVNTGSCSYIDSYCFSGCYDLTTVVFGSTDSLNIGDGVFNNCTALTGLVLPDSVIHLGKEAFQLCKSLTGTFVLPAKLVEGDSTLNERLFNGCSGLTEIQIPSGLKHIQSGVFQGCTGLTSLTLPTSLEDIGLSGTFSGVSCITEMDLSPYKIYGDDTTASYTFSGCTNLKSPTLPSGVTALVGTFNDCSSLESFVIPEGVTSLGSSCFYNCSSLASITIPEGVTSLGSSCFYNCSSLASITISDSVTSIGYECFYNCSSLASITIPEGVTSLGSSCFYNCSSLASITIPEGVTSLGSTCFGWCSSLVSITMLPTTPPTLGLWALSTLPSSLIITVPKGCLDAYKTATNWSAYADKMVEASE